ncbi:TIGR02677 family protein [Jiangella rhizosphaerae]|uniref:TIGR02677 family protein n=1 Tax=Jiangella rhizosphaerae TaxID=2293569 RepID=A0A418KM62_9ACTN|nr:TIGR02677 family protein [Jiangella rhizosphaerae]RIQ19472.1 TIGR02677 family protein [Jiangella rhizosphaerae]
MSDSEVRRRADLVSASDAPTNAVASTAQPFAHLNAPNAGLYRSVMRTFARAKERFIVHLRPEDVAAELTHDSDEQLVQALEQLVQWGNLRADPDTSRATSPEDFHRKRFLYQLTTAGHAAEQAIAFYEQAIGRRGALQSVALEDIAEQLAALLVLAEQPEPDPAKTHRLLLSLAERFTSLADNAQAFMASLRRAIDFSDGDVEGFVAYKERLIDYINRFIADLANSGARIATLLADLESRDHDRLLRLAAWREALDSVPDGPNETDAYARAENAALATWHNRWRGLRDWFVSADAGHPSQARLLRQAAVTAIKQLIDTVGMLNERRTGRSDRSADFRTLARWFAEAPDEDAMHRLWRAAFGLSPARHLSVTATTLTEWDEAEPPPSTPWSQAPPIRISPQLRRTGSYERRGRPHRVEDRSAARELLRRQAEQEAAELAAARRRLATNGPLRLSQLGELDTRAFRLFLALLGDALAARLPGDTEVKTTTSDGSMEVRLSLLQDGGGSGCEVVILTEDGVLRGPEHLIEITDLAGGP